MWKTWMVVLPLGLMSCGPGADGSDLCQDIFEPYPDMVSQRTRTTGNALYLDGMALYANEDYAGARDSLEKYLDVQRADLTGYMYLACAYLALGNADKAELQLDHLGRGNNLHYTDQIEWYRLVCWVCGGQLERARQGAQRIVDKGAHTYKREAMDLLDRLPKGPGR